MAGVYETPGHPTFFLTRFCSKMPTQEQFDDYPVKSCYLRHFPSCFLWPNINMIIEKLQLTPFGSANSDVFLFLNIVRLDLPENKSIIHQGIKVKFLKTYWGNKLPGLIT